MGAEAVAASALNVSISLYQQVKRALAANNREEERRSEEPEIDGGGRNMGKKEEK